MVACPKCGNVVAKPEKELENSLFYLACYICDKCGKHFIVDHKQSNELHWGNYKAKLQLVAKKKGNKVGIAELIEVAKLWLFVFIQIFLRTRGISKYNVFFKSVF